VFIIFLVFLQFSTMENDERIFLIKFGENIRKIRISLNLSQEMLANDANIPINQIGRIERAEISTSLNTIFKIAKALSIDPNKLFLFDISKQ
jgi:transcriptional regulator with XRE-family HTH domain